MKNKRRSEGGIDVLALIRVDGIDDHETDEKTRKAENSGHISKDLLHSRKTSEEPSGSLECFPEITNFIDYKKISL
ncbi:hypothetical protein YDYSG_12430 [Paenibacillus tyrfis]|nr:hypothetical protein YDYSG_12430 [Paenibacillus tyrfis]GMX64078.1 hypothetical protein Elgi_33940 [Paenibacillus elgii]